MKSAFNKTSLLQFSALFVASTFFLTSHANAQGNSGFGNSGFKGHTVVIKQNAKPARQGANLERANSARTGNRQVLTPINVDPVIALRIQEAQQRANRLLLQQALIRRQFGESVSGPRRVGAVQQGNSVVTRPLRVDPNTTKSTVQRASSIPVTVSPETIQSPFVDFNLPQVHTPKPTMVKNKFRKVETQKPAKIESDSRQPFQHPSMNHIPNPHFND